MLGFMHSATLPDILDNSTSAVHPCIVYESFTGMASTWEANFSYTQIYTKLNVGSVADAQGRIAVKVLQLQGERSCAILSKVLSPGKCLIIINLIPSRDLPKKADGIGQSRLVG